MWRFETWLPLLLLPLPFLVYRFSKSLHDSEQALRVPFINAIESITTEHSTTQTQSILSWVFLLVLWLLLLISCCRPVWLGDAIPVQQDARNILLAVDISESMLDRDIALNNRYVSRIDLVKYRLGEFIQRRQQDRLGLVLFADNAYLQSPLTFDVNTVNQFLQEARVGFAGRNTAIGDAIGLGVKRLVERNEASRILILLTDGANTAGSVDPLEASEVAAEQGIKIYTIGIYQPNAGFTRTASRSLTRIAKMTGGQYFIASNDQELERVYRELDKLEPVEQDDRLFQPKIDYFHLPLTAFVTLSMIGLLLRYAENQYLPEPKGLIGSNTQTSDTSFLPRSEKTE